MPEEKRAYPRIKSRLKAIVGNKIPADVYDLSEGGAGLDAGNKLPQKTFSLKILFPKRHDDFKARGRVAWQKNGQDKSLCGVEFLSLNRAQRTALRSEVVKTHISGLSKNIWPAQKRNVRNFFLKDVMDYMGRIESFLPDIRENSDYSFRIQKEFDHITTQILLKGYCLEELLADAGASDKIKNGFRGLIGSWLYRSEILKDISGIASGRGDRHRFLDIIYENKLLSEGLGRYIDNYFLRSPYAVAMRLRKEKIKELLLGIIKESSAGHLSILSMGCGKCREIWELSPELKSDKKLIFTCVDYDDLLLDASKKTLVMSAPNNVKFRFVNAASQDMAANGDTARYIGEHDVIYSLGLIDYLEDNTLKHLIQLLYGCLRKNGTMIITHKNKEKTFPPLTPDWLCGWRSIPRSIDDIAGLLRKAGIPDTSITTKSDDFQYIRYFIITKG